MDSYKLFALLFIVILFFVCQIDHYGWFRVTSLWARKIDRRLKDMLWVEEMPSSAHSVSKAFRRECADFLEAKCRSAPSKSECEFRKAYYSGDSGFYEMAATLSYRNLLFSPFALYSRLSQEHAAGYGQIFRYSVAKLVEIGTLDESFYGRAMAELESVEDFCQAQRAAGNFVDW